MIGLLHPGAMGAAVGGALVGAGLEVAWASAERSDQSRARADRAGLTDLGTIEQLVTGSDMILSVCPPEAAVRVAEQVATQGFAGTYLDANAVSPATADRIGGIVRASGAIFVDGGIIGLPPEVAGTTRLYLSGNDADAASDRLRNSVLDVIALTDEGGAASTASASALKMVYAAWSKISTALLLSTVETAGRLGVGGALADEWVLSQPAAVARLAGAQSSADAKGWRWGFEMEEIAATFASVGSPAGFGEAASDVFRNFAKPVTGFMAASRP
jgi:3-hydroxyisobutyrate dehydrogenase-like beta-hydroxyacid dehydrogenase